MNKTNKYHIIFQGEIIHKVPEKIVKDNNINDYDLFKLKELILNMYLIRTRLTKEKNIDNIRKLLNKAFILKSLIYHIIKK